MLSIDIWKVITWYFRRRVGHVGCRVGHGRLGRVAQIGWGNVNGDFTNCRLWSAVKKNPQEYYVIYNTSGPNFQVEKWQLPACFISSKGVGEIHESI